MWDEHQVHEGKVVLISILLPNGNCVPSTPSWRKILILVVEWSFQVNAASLSPLLCGAGHYNSGVGCCCLIILGHKYVKSRISPLTTPLTVDKTSPRVSSVVFIKWHIRISDVREEAVEKMLPKLCLTNKQLEKINTGLFCYISTQHTSWWQGGGVLMNYCEISLSTLLRLLRELRQKIS